ncbi:MAG: sigma-70 family RNA polymerase sigma factor [Gemmatimonadetes bacterium]|nr:sigma-70 family RNA polymerase sigma factor [Gemmatimonadota bacterium]
MRTVSVDRLEGFHPPFGVILPAWFWMLDQQNYEALFLENLRWIERAAEGACRRQGIFGADAEDFAASVKMKLMENDYAAMRGFRGTATIRTYLGTVIMHHLHDQVRERRGRWRPSAAAERLGPPAGELEDLVNRQGYTVSQAGELLRTAGRTSLGDADLARLLAQLPPRTPLRPVEVSAESALFSVEGPSQADERVAASEAEARRERLLLALKRAREMLKPEEQVIVRLHFEEGKSVADVARALRLEQKPLYRRVERLRARLREHLEHGGVGARDVREILGGEEAE